MSLSKQANNKFAGKSVRFSTGPLYSGRELEQAQQALARDGYTKVEDNKALGMSIYNKTQDGQKTGDAVIYLDHLGCHPDSSGIMFITENGKESQATTIWNYARQKRIEAATNPVTRFLRRMF